MNAKNSTMPKNYDPRALTRDLQYVWIPPTSSKRLQGSPYWTNPEANPDADLIKNLTGLEWKVAYIRQQIDRLGVKPKGRTRADLMHQLIETFLDPHRFARQLGQLNEEELGFYTYLLLYTNLESLRTTPAPMEKTFRLPRQRVTLTDNIIKAGMGLQYEHGQFFIPGEALRLLPPTYLPFESEPEPQRFMAAKDPQLLTSQIQQWLSQLQTQKYRLRARPRWKMPNAGYMSNYQVWPPLPEFAQRIKSGKHFQGAVALCTPEPYPDDTALEAWSSSLGLSPDTVEFIYHTLSNTHIVWPGDPVKLDQKLLQPWMTCTPGRQVVLLYEHFRSINLWASWWPLWRRGQITVDWNYQNYWGLSNIDNYLITTHYMLRWVLLDILAALPHDTWLSLKKVSDFIGKLYPRANSHLYQQGLLFKGTPKNWKGFLRMALQALLTGPLHQMGFVDLAPDADKLDCFRLHYLQDVHWGRYEEVPTTKAEPLSAKTVRYLADSKTLQIVPPAPAKFLSAIQRWAKPAGLVDNRLHYMLDVEHLHSAFERGETPKTLAHAWETHADFAPLPEIVDWWQHWWSRYGHIRLYTHQATLMTRDDFTMHELQIALPSLRDSILGLVTPSTALLQSEHVDKILQDLERQGYMPKEED
jgi:hypothetical protein